MTMASPDFSDGCMIALYPPAELAKDLAVDGGLPPQEMHVTVAYCGHADDVDQDALNAAVEDAAPRQPIRARISGLARFTGGEQDVIVALVDSPDLEGLRRNVLDALADHGVTIPREHGYTAHITLTYIDPDDPSPVHRIGARDVEFGALTAVHGTDRKDIPLAHPIEAFAREAYAAGWAYSGGPMTDRVRAGCTAAVALAVEHAQDPRILEVTLDLGRLEGMWAKLFARREQLIAQHARTVTRAWRAAVSRSLLAAAVRAVHLRHTRETSDPSRDDVAAATSAVAAVLASLPNRPEWTALRQALRDALAAGRAEGAAGAATIAADQAGEEPPDWEVAFQDAYDTLAVDHTLWAEADTWLQRLLQRAAADLGRALADQEAAGASAEDMVDAADTTLDSGDVEAVDFTADWAITTALAAGALAWYQQQGAAQLSWVTVGDGRVCETCHSNEDRSPYPLDQFPAMPAHPLCRCIATTS